MPGGQIIDTRQGGTRGYGSIVYVCVGVPVSLSVSVDMCVQRQMSDM